MGVLSELRVVTDVLTSISSIAQVNDALVLRYCNGKINLKVHFEYTQHAWLPRIDAVAQSIEPRFFVVIGTRKNNFHTRDVLNGKGVILHASPKVLIVESVSDNTHWFAPSAAEKKQLLKQARTTARNVLSAISRDKHVGTSIYQNNAGVTVCAAFWTKGRIRASMSARAATVTEATICAVEKALSFDDRFKPLSVEELDETIIEITIFSPIQIKVDTARFREIDYSKGYSAYWRSKWGMFVPEVFNAKKFSHGEDFLKSLLVQKGGIPWSEIHHTNVCMFDVCDFIENQSPIDMLPMFASMPTTQVVELDDVQKHVFTTASKAIQWLQIIKEKDGNIPAVAEPLSCALKQFDIARVAFVAYALAEWSLQFPAPQLAETVQEVIAYCKKNILRLSSRQNISNASLYGFVYLGHASVTLQDHQTALECVRILRKHIKKNHINVILFLQTISLFERIEHHTDLDTRNFVDELKNICKQKFYETQTQKETDSATWAEAVVSFAHCDTEFSMRVTQWILEHQIADGSFTQSHSSNWSYTRGSAKIFEVLASEHLKHATQLQALHAWLVSMQYTSDNTFFISPDFVKDVVGGFRHDYGNPDAWIDSAGHYILGATRFLQK